jgi:hypothetical protein
MPKKFADKLSLESTHFQDLQHVVEEAIQFAKDAQYADDLNTVESAPAGECAIKVAKAFCRLQDQEREEE